MAEDGDGDRDDAVERFDVGNRSSLEALLRCPEQGFCIWSRRHGTGYCARPLLTTRVSVRDQRAGPSGSGFSLNGFEDVSAIKEWQSPIEAVGIGPGEIAEDEVVDVVEQVVGISHAKVDRGTGVHGGQILGGRRAIEEGCVGTDGNTAGGGVEKEKAVGAGIDEALGVGRSFKSRGKEPRSIERNHLGASQAVIRLGSNPEDNGAHGTRLTGRRDGRQFDNDAVVVSGKQRNRIGHLLRQSGERRSACGGSGTAVIEPGGRHGSRDAKGAAVLLEYAYTNDAISAQSLDVVVVRAALRATGGNVREGGISKDIDGNRSSFFAGDLDVGGTDSSPQEAAVQKLRALGDRMVTRIIHLRERKIECAAGARGEQTQSIGTGVDQYIRNGLAGGSARHANNDAGEDTIGIVTSDA